MNIDEIRKDFDEKGLYLVLRGKLTGCVGKWSWLRLDTCLSIEDIDKLNGGA